jgi:hypothetical protein
MFRFGVSGGNAMDDPATGTKPGNVSSSGKASHYEDRNTWVLTMYAISGLVFFGLLFYYIAQYVVN